MKYLPCDIQNIILDYLDFYDKFLLIIYNPILINYVNNYCLLNIKAIFNFTQIKYNPIIVDIIGFIIKINKINKINLGLRLFNTPIQLFDNHKKILLLTSNPGGSTYEKDKIFANHAYINESWKNNKIGEENLQKQIRQLFNKLNEYLQFYDKDDELLKNCIKITRYE